MDIRLRHIILMATTVLMTAACSSDSVSEPEPQPQTQEPVPTVIGFRAAMSDATRAVGDGELTDALLQAKGFGVYCWYTGTTDFSTPVAAATMLMRNQKVEWKKWDGVTDTWNYTPSKYWPLNPAEKLTFRAYAPFTDYLLEDANGMPQLPVVVDKDDYTNGTQHDPLWGTGRLIDPSTDGIKEYYAEGNTYGSPYDNYTYAMSGTYRKNAVPDPTEGTIHWYFHHGMAKLLFFAKLEDRGSDEQVYITNITIGPLYDKGLLSINSPAASSSDKPTWNVSEGEDMTVTLNGYDGTYDGSHPDNPELDEDKHDLQHFVIIKDQKDEHSDVILNSGLRLLTNPGLLVIPRVYGASELTITVSYKRALDDDKEYTVSTTIDNQTFEGNTIYTLNMTVSSALNVVIESVNVAFLPWDTSKNVDYEIYNW